MCGYVTIVCAVFVVCVVCVVSLIPRKLGEQSWFRQEKWKGRLIGKDQHINLQRLFG